MTVAALREPATSTEDRAERRAEKDVPAIQVQVATAPTGKVCAEKLNLMVFTARAIGWVVEFLTTSASHAPVIEGKHSDAGAHIAELCEKVDAMGQLHTDWNGYGSEPPYEFAREM